MPLSLGRPTLFLGPYVSVVVRAFADNDISATVSVGTHACNAQLWFTQTERQNGALVVELFYTMESFSQALFKYPKNSLIRTIKLFMDALQLSTSNSLQ